jgi:hypothetical protein
MLQNNLRGIHLAHMTQSHNAFNASELRQLVVADGSAAVHRGPHARINTQEFAAGFETVKKVG